MTGMFRALPRVLMMPRWPHGRSRNVIATVAVATVVVAGAALIPGTTTVPTSPAGTDWWVNPTNGNNATCVRGNQSFPCLNISGVYSKATLQCGDEVELMPGATGLYPAQTLTANAVASACTSNPIVFQAATEGTVTFNAAWGTTSLTIGTGAINATFKNITITWLTGGSCSAESSNVTFQDTNLRYFELVRTRNWVFTSGEVGPSESTNTIVAHPLVDDCGSPKTAVNYNLMFDHMYFHDVYTATGSDTHTECLLVTGVDGLTVQNSRFFNCDSTGDMYITRWNFGGATDNSQGVVQNVLIQNNMFMDDTGYTGGPAGSEDSQPSSIQMDTDAQIDFINNTWTKSLLIDDASNGGTSYPSRTIRFINNYGSTTDCGNAFTTFQNNVWHHSPAISGFEFACNGALQAGNIQVVNRQTDLHLSGNNTTAKDAASATFAPATDFDGDTRPIGAADDVGADEKS